MSRKLKLWVDDLRPPPDDTWQWAKTSREAIEHIDYLATEQPVTDSYEKLVMSLDHDLGDDDTTRSVVLWICEEYLWWPDQRPSVHSANPVGREWLNGMIDRYHITRDEFRVGVSSGIEKP